MQIVRANVRQPDEVIGDFTRRRHATTPAARALEMMEEFA
jgi:hypothetical protein